MSAESTPLSVTEYISELNAKLATIFGDVVGEVSEVKIAASGHCYFTLKDKNSGDTLPCTLWRTKYQLNGVDIEVGMELLVKGKPEYYGPFGKLSLIVSSAQLVGEGALLKAYEKLKKKLEAEGIFDESKKRAIPLYPHKIGVVTSVHGAVIHDFNKNLKKYGFKVKIRDTRVEGPESGKDITLSVRAFRKEDIDVLVLLRGGGSVQSLAGFDNEALVGEIATFPKPVIAGLGHHQDVPLAALAADAMQSTPSLVAEMLNESWNTAQYSLERSEDKILRGYQTLLWNTRSDLDREFVRVERNVEIIFALYKRAEQTIQDAVVKIGFTIGQTKKELQDTVSRITNHFGVDMKSRAVFLVSVERLIETNNPERQLKLGYSLAFSGGKVVRSSRDVQKGVSLNVRFAEGSAETIITEIT